MSHGVKSCGHPFILLGCETCFAYFKERYKPACHHGASGMDHCENCRVAYKSAYGMPLNSPLIDALKGAFKFKSSQLITPVYQQLPPPLLPPSPVYDTKTVQGSGALPCSGLSVFENFTPFKKGDVVKIVGKPVPLLSEEVFSVALKPLKRRVPIRINRALGVLEYELAWPMSNPGRVPWCADCEDRAEIDAWLGYIYCPRGHGALREGKVLWKHRRHEA